MNKGINLWQHLADAADLPGEDQPGQSVVELMGNSRVLIENHYGVKEYSREKIGVKVRWGTVCVCGCALELTAMTRERLVIRGKIYSITAERRGNT